MTSIVRRALGLLLGVAFAAGLLVSAVANAAADTYPLRPITLIVPFPPGGSTDTMARLLGQHMHDLLGQPVVIENVGGATGRIAVQKAVRATPDGYTLLIGTSTTNMLVGGLYQLPFDLLGDLDPIILIGNEPLLLAGKKDLPAKNLQEFIAWLKANPGKASCGIAGVGATGHVAGLAFQKETGTSYLFVPYRGNGPGMKDLIGGQIDFMMEPASNFLGPVKAGLIKPFAVTATSRTTSMPDVPTMTEAGLKGFTASLWYGLWVPKGTPKDIEAKLNAVMVKVLALPAVQEHFKVRGTQMNTGSQTPQGLRDFQKAEAARWWPIIKAAHINAK
ncbi:MAG: tripartite tricarboxylate transporter substrate binding protein BugD [Rhodopseudomonas sp.]|nr:tripartite tricarboxylate transporter substrate binding protein BugD [Rhodopseudomonas sp.]